MGSSGHFLREWQVIFPDKWKKKKPLNQPDELTSGQNLAGLIVFVFFRQGNKCGSELLPVTTCSFMPSERPNFHNCVVDPSARGDMLNSRRLIETNHFSLCICPQRLGKDESCTVPITVNWSCSLLTNSFKCANTVLYIPLSMRCVSLIHINPVPRPAQPLSAVTSLKTRISTTDPRRRMRASSAQIQLGHLCAFPYRLKTFATALNTRQVRTKKYSRTNEMRHLNAQLRSWFRSSSFPKSRPVNAAGAPTPITLNHGKLVVERNAFLIGL